MVHITHSIHPVMLENDLFVAHYLERIRFTNPLTLTVEILKELHKQHQLHIPIENLDIHTGKAIILNLQAFYDKIIRNQRGGFCYELNGLFYELLKKAGFQVKMVSGRVFAPGQNSGYFRDEFDHIALIVSIENETWLADVAMGRMFSLYPLKVSPREVQTDPTGNYRIIQHDAQYLGVQQLNDAGEWIYAYLFTLAPRELHEFEAMCHFQQTSEQSYFTQQKLCTLVTPGGRITLTDKVLKMTEGAQVSGEPVTDEVDFYKKLKAYFGITIP